jgi:PRTRC genetic system protein C
MYSRICLPDIVTVNVFLEQSHRCCEIQIRRKRKMPVTLQKLERTFLFNGAKLPDPNPEFSVEQVRDMYVNTYPELATAAIEGPTPVSGAMQYVFTRAVGAKG